MKGIFVQLLFTCLYIIKVINQCVKHISVKLPAMLTNNVYFCHRTCWYRFIMRLSVGFEIFKLELFKNTLIIILRNKWTFCRVKCMSGGKNILRQLNIKVLKQIRLNVVIRLKTMPRFISKMRFKAVCRVWIHMSGTPLYLFQMQKVRYIAYK